MRKLVYSVAMSLDGFIAKEDGSYDWIPEDDDIEWDAMLARFDCLLMGRGTYEIGEDGPPDFPGYSYVVVSTTLDPADHPGVTIISEDVEAEVRALKEQEGKDIWLFGGGVLFRGLLEAGLVDEVEVGVIPALLGQGIPLLPGALEHTVLSLVDTKVYEGSGIVMVRYGVGTG